MNANEGTITIGEPMISIFRVSRLEITYCRDNEGTAKFEVETKKGCQSFREPFSIIRFAYGHRPTPARIAKINALEAADDHILQVYQSSITKLFGVPSDVTVMREIFERAEYLLQILLNKGVDISNTK